MERQRGGLTVWPESEVNWKSQGSPGVLLTSHAEPNLLVMGPQEPPPPRMFTAVMPPNPAVFCMYNTSFAELVWNVDHIISTPCSNMMRDIDIWVTVTCASLCSPPLPDVASHQLQHCCQWLWTQGWVVCSPHVGTGCRSCRLPWEQSTGNKPSGNADMALQMPISPCRAGDNRQTSVTLKVTEVLIQAAKLFCDKERIARGDAFSNFGHIEHTKWTTSVHYLVEGECLDVQVVGFALWAGVSDGDGDGLRASTSSLYMFSTVKRFGQGNNPQYPCP